jgi:hypothetical protein
MELVVLAHKKKIRDSVDKFMHYLNIIVIYMHN